MPDDLNPIGDDALEEIRQALYLSTTKEAAYQVLRALLAREGERVARAIAVDLTPMSMPTERAIAIVRRLLGVKEAK